MHARAEVSSHLIPGFPWEQAQLKPKHLLLHLSLHLSHAHPPHFSLRRAHVVACGVQRQQCQPSMWDCSGCVGKGMGKAIYHSRLLKTGSRPFLHWRGSCRGLWLARWAEMGSSPLTALGKLPHLPKARDKAGNSNNLF